MFKCPECDDGSVQVIMAAEPCLECDGEGFVDVLIAEGETVRKTCHECEGVGAPMVWMTYQDCHGTAEIFVDDEEAAELMKDGHTPLRRR